MCQKIKSGTFASGFVAYLTVVNPTTKQVETLFSELEYIEMRLEALGVVTS